MIFGLWVAYGGGDADSGDLPLIHGVGLIVWWAVTLGFVRRSINNRP